MATNQFNFSARTESGELRKGVEMAQSIEEATFSLKNRGLVVTQIQPVKKNMHFDIGKILSYFRRLSLTEKAVFTHNLYIMVKSSIPLAQSLGTLAQQTKNRSFAQDLTSMKARIEKGETFAKVLSSYPRDFSEVYIAMVAAGEASGRLETILQELAKQIKKERILIAKIKGAMTYPIIVVIAMISIGIAMMVLVIPKITGIYTDAGAQLPLPTRILVGISNFLVHNGIVVAVAFVFVVIVFQRILKTRKGKRFFDTLWLKLPIAGTIIAKINLARFSRTLTSLLKTDIPIVQSFQIIERTLGSIPYQESMRDAGLALKKGVTVVNALQARPKLFPPLVTQIISVGEESGTLDELSGEIAEFYEEDVDETMSNFSAIIEPVLLLLLGLGVGAMAVAILLPIYSLTEQI